METTTTKWFERLGTEFTGTVRVWTPGGERHLPVRLQVKDADNASFDFQDACTRCGGAGGASQWAYTGYKCFDCGGHGKGKIRTVKLYSEARLAKLSAAQIKRDAKAAEKNHAAAEAEELLFQAWKTEHTDTLVALRAEMGTDAFLNDLVRRVDQGLSLTGRQMEAGLAAVSKIQAKRAANAVRQYVGTVGERIELTVTTTKVVRLEDRFQDNIRTRFMRFAPRYLVLMADAEGNVFKYTGSGSFPPEGETRSGKATVKDHSEYNGVKQTTIERPKWTPLVTFETTENGMTIIPTGEIGTEGNITVVPGETVGEVSFCESLIKR